MTKTIQLNPQFLSSSSTRNTDTRKMRDKKEKPNTLVQPNNMRNQLLKKIKDYQSKTEGAAATETDTDRQNILEFSDEFNKSLHFLQDLTNKKNDLFKPSKTRKNPKSYEVDIDLPDEMKTNDDIINNESKPINNEPINNESKPINNDPINDEYKPINDKSIFDKSIFDIPTEVAPTTTSVAPSKIQHTTISTFTAPTIQFKPSTYSSIKNGSKPTYRELNNTNKPMITIEDKPNTIESENHKMLEKIKSDYKKSNIQTQSLEGGRAEYSANEVGANQVGANELGSNQVVVGANQVEPRILRRIKRTTRTCKYRLGKLGNKVSVLIKDYKTRKNIQNECYKLEKTSITDVKNFLRKKNLLKVGSVADDAVLREMYEQCILAGDIQNNNKETLIHNYLTK
jgi:hypothetical protein